MKYEDEHAAMKAADEDRMIKDAEWRAVGYGKAAYEAAVLQGLEWGWDSWANISADRQCAWVAVAQAVLRAKQ
jgi:hypothetical protein